MKKSIQAGFADSLDMRARAHRAGADDALVSVAPVLERYGRFADFLGREQEDEAAWRGLRMSETSGRSLGGDAWLEELEAKTDRTLKPQKRGPKPRRIKCI